MFVARALRTQLEYIAPIEVSRTRVSARERERDRIDSLISHVCISQTAAPFFQQSTEEQLKLDHHQESFF